MRGRVWLTPCDERRAGDVESGRSWPTAALARSGRDDLAAVTGLAFQRRDTGVDEVKGDRGLGALVALCQELAKLGFRVGMSDARPALSVRGDLVDRRVWIEIAPSGESFVWRRDHQVRHAVGDPAGAATEIAEYLKLRDSGSGAGS